MNSDENIARVYISGNPFREKTIFSLRFQGLSKEYLVVTELQVGGLRPRV